MPELPEVETTVRGLRKYIVGKTIVSVWTDPKWPTKASDGMNWEKRRKLFEGKKIKDVTRRAKYIVIGLSGGDSIYIHQKMSGHLLVGNWKTVKGIWRPVESGPMEDARNQYMRAMFGLSGGMQMALSDTRRFATITYVSDPKEHKHLSKLGPEPLDISLEDFHKLFRTPPDKSVFDCNCKTSVANLQKFSQQSGGSASKISSDSHSKLCNFVTKETYRKGFVKKGVLKPVLMNPEFIVGIGNIYADEILWTSGLHPLSRVESLKEKDRETLWRNSKIILAKAIKLGGSSVGDYRTSTGESGEFQDFHNAYQRTGEKCKKNDGGVIKRILVGQRSTHFCPKHQQLK